MNKKKLLPRVRVRGYSDSKKKRKEKQLEKKLKNKINKLKRKLQTEGNG